MAAKIRLRRVGRKNAPMYRIVVADARSPRDGKFIEIIGQYAPRTSDQPLQLKTERAHYWLGVGAQPTDTVRSLLRRAGILKERHESHAMAKRESQAKTMRGKAVPVREDRTEA